MNKLYFKMLIILVKIIFNRLLDKIINSYKNKKNNKLICK